MSELEVLKKLVIVLTNQRDFAFNQLAQMEATLLLERETKQAAPVPEDERDGHSH
jgi:hypothetical protein